MEPKKGGIVGPTIFFSKRQIELLKGVVASIEVTQFQQATTILNEHNVERINKVQSLQSNDVRGRLANEIDQIVSQDGGGMPLDPAFSNVR